MTDIADANHLSALQRTMRWLADAVDDLPRDCQPVIGNALLNLAAEKVVEDVGYAEASRIFLRLGTLLQQNTQPPVDSAISLSSLDA